MKRQFQSQRPKGALRPFQQRHHELKEDLETLRGLHNLLSDLGRLPDSVAKDALREGILEAIHTYKVGATKQAETKMGQSNEEPCRSDLAEEEPPYAKWLSKGNFRLSRTC